MRKPDYVIHYTIRKGITYKSIAHRAESIEEAIFYKVLHATRYTLPASSCGIILAKFADIMEDLI